MPEYDPRQMVLFEDAALLVVNKPAGLLSLRDGYDKNLPHLVTVLSPVFGRLWMVHRLDRDTSGVMIVARTPEAHHFLNDQFRDRDIQKTYHALVTGCPSWEEVQCDAPLRKDGDRQHRTVIDAPWGKPASTVFRVLEKLGNYALVEVRPHTGYTHQIRAHAAFLGHPLLGDALYGFKERPPELPTPPAGEPPAPILSRPGLHALSITFQHPVTRQNLTFSAPYPEDFARAIKLLRQTT